jgi:hypothetical protein
MTHTLYLDCEFTSLPDPKLLSVGLVSFRGDEFYVELDLAHPDSQASLAYCSDFVRESVLPLWGRVDGSAMDYPLMGQRTAEWLRAQVATLGQPARIVFDYPADYELLKKLLRDTGGWEEVRPVVRPVYLREHLGRLDANLSAEAMFGRLAARNLERHHALADAHALRAAHYALLTGKYLKS